MFYHFKIFKQKKGYWAKCVELEGLQTQADSLNDLNQNMKEALDLFLSEPESSSVLFPEPKKRLRSKKNIVAVKVDARVAFALLLRKLRIEQNLTQREMANILEFKNIYSYQKLENHKTSNPELVTLAKIKNKFPDFDIDEAI